MKKLILLSSLIILCSCEQNKTKTENDCVQCYREGWHAATFNNLMLISKEITLDEYKTRVELISKCTNTAQLNNLPW